MQGKNLGPYSVIGELAAGGMATVYVARHNRLGHVVAIKVLHPHYQADTELRQRFVDEARIQANLRHPNVLVVHDILELPDSTGMVMELLIGGTLATYFRAMEKPMPFPQLFRLFMPLADGLAYAHSAGVVHRDLKPSNIFLHCNKQDVIPKLTDFGIAKLQRMESDGGHTAAGTLLGTPHYMAPEQFEDASTVDHRADIYSMGVMLYQASTGVLPFPGKSIAEIMKAVLTTQPIPPSKLRSGFPPELEDVILACLFKERDLRPPSAESIFGTLERLADKLGSEAIRPADVPQMDLKQKGINLTGPITSSTTERSIETHKPQAKQKGNGETEDSWHVPPTNLTVGVKSGRKIALLVAGLVLLAILGVLAFVLFSPNKKDSIEATRRAAADASSKTEDRQPDASAEQPGAGERKERRPVEELPAALPFVPHKGLTLGSGPTANSNSVAVRMTEARLHASWLGLSFKEVSEEGLRPFGLTWKEISEVTERMGRYSQYSSLDNLYRTVASPFSRTSPLNDLMLDQLLVYLRDNAEAERFVKAKARALCELPFESDENIGKLLQSIRDEAELSREQFEKLEGTIWNGTSDLERLLKAEIASRAVLCIARKMK